MYSISAVLPARRNDSLLENKNLLPFQGIPLIEYKIKELLQIPAISSILICSDDDAVIDIANKYNLETLRRKDSFSEQETLADLIEHAMEKVQTTDILWANCCTPLVGQETYEDAIGRYYEKTAEGYDSLMSVLPFKKYVLDDNGPVNFQVGVRHQESQILNTLYFWIPAFSIASKENMLQWKYTWGKIPYKYPLSKKEAFEIKDKEDLDFIQLYYKGE